MFSDIFTKDVTLDEEQLQSAYALLCKYLIKHIDTINDANVQTHVAYWFVEMEDDGVEKEQLKIFKKELGEYIPNAIH